MFLFDVFIANYIYIYIYILEKIEKILKYRLDFCKIMLKAIVDSLRRMGCLRFPLPLRCNADCTSPTLRASPWGEVPSLSRRRGVMTIKRKNCSPLSVALTGASSPQGGAFFSNKTASGNQAFKKAASLQR